MFCARIQHISKTKSYHCRKNNENYIDIFRYKVELTFFSYC